MDAFNVFRGLTGIAFLIFVLFLFSENRKKISWKLVGMGMMAQFIFAILILKVTFVQNIFEFISSFFVLVLNFTHQGANFLFGPLMDNTKIGFTFAFQILPTIIFFSALTSLLFYFGILQKIVFVLSWLLKKTVKISGAENLSTTANIFLGQTEAPLLIKPYLSSMTRSEIFCVMVGGMANTAGGVLAAYVGFLGGSDPVAQLFFAKHLLAASVMSAPATIVVAKILIPQTEEVDEHIEIPKDKIGANLLEAISIGTTDGLKLAVNVGAMLIVFIALMAMLNHILGGDGGIGGLTGLNEKIAEWTNGKYTSLSLQLVLGYLCAPIVWILGIAQEDMLYIGQLLGEKTILNEFVAYTSLAKMKAEGVISNERSILLATYILSGFANFSSIGIQIGGIGALAPNKRSQLAQLGIKALIGGTVATLMMAALVGIFI
jgi:CNT family concentrative nucleoside transporter